MNTEKLIKSGLTRVVALMLAVAMLILSGCSKKQEGGSSIVSEESSSNVSADNSSSGITETESFTVTFKDFDGTVLKNQKVESGKGATPPQNPVRENFKFAGWDKSFNEVTSDLVVTATYITTKTVIYAERVSVDKGTKQAKVDIRVINNPGILGAVLKVFVDNKALVFDSASKTEFPGLTLTSPGSAAASSPYTFMLDALELTSNDKKDGTLFTVTFNVNDSAAKGKYNVTLAFDKGAIFDENLKDAGVVLENGSVTIK